MNFTTYTELNPHIIADLTRVLDDRRKKNKQSSSPLSPAFLAEWKSFLLSINASNDTASTTDLFENGETLCIVSGQQIGLGLGPLLTLYKIISTEVLADLFSEKMGVKIIPVFWLQTEDHDLEEISSINLIDQSGKLNSSQLFSQDISKHNRISVGALEFREDFQGNFETFIRSADRDIRDENSIWKILYDSYSGGVNLALAFGRLYYNLFPDSRVLLFDPRLPLAKSAASAVYQAALKHDMEIADILVGRTSEIEKSGRIAPVSIRKDSPLFFYHPQGPDQGRFRLTTSSNGDFLEPASGLTKSREILNEEMNSSPASFSSSALLRPLIQDYLFPIIAFIGGEAELAYLEQLDPVYDFLSITKPLRILRAKGLLLDEKLEQFLTSKDLPPSFILINKQEDLKKAFLDSEASTLIIHNLQGKLKLPLDEISAILVNEGLDKIPDLEKPAAKTVSSLNESLQKLMNKYQQYLLRTDNVAAARLERISEIAFPNGIPQERIITSIWLFKDEVSGSDDKYRLIYEKILNSYNNSLSSEIE